MIHLHWGKTKYELKKSPENDIKRILESTQDWTYNFQILSSKILIQDNTKMTHQLLL